MSGERRLLRFERLQDAVVDAQNLLDCGYARVGNWSLAECCRHLALLMQYPLDGFPRYPIWTRIPMWVLRYTYAPRMLRKVLESEKWPERIPTDGKSVPKETGSDVEGVAELRVAVDRLVNYSGVMKASPLLGLLDKPTLIKLHCIHAAHHLGFLIPSAEGERD